MIEPTELDLAQLRHELRKLYSYIGYDAALQLFYENLVGITTFGEIILEERQKEKGDK